MRAFVLSPYRWIIVLVITCGGLVGLLAIADSHGAEDSFASSTTSFEPDLNSAWQHDAIWYDGKAEYAVYESHRSIYGQDREYETVIITNKQRMDPNTTTKSADWQAPRQVEVFKHNVREVIETENYDYKFLTTSFIHTDSLDPFKVTMSSQEDCGATFKHFVTDGKHVTADTFVYFPDGGPSHETYRVPAHLQFEDALTLVLRSFPFNDPPAEPLSIILIPDMTDTHATAHRPVTSEITYAGVVHLSVPEGNVETHRLDIKAADGTTTSYWFAKDQSPDWLGILVQFEGAYGVRYLLRSHSRWDYWNRDSPRPATP